MGCPAPVSLEISVLFIWIPAAILMPPVTMAYIPQILTSTMAVSVGNSAIRKLKNRVTIPQRTIARFVFHSSEMEHPTMIRSTLLMMARIAMIMMNVDARNPGNRIAIVATIRESSPAKKMGKL